MGRRSLIVLGLICGFQAGALAVAATSPARVVQQFVEAHLQGRFAAARGVTLEQVNLSTSLFSNWLFGPRGVGGDAATADVFLSRKFAQAFRYNVIGTTSIGDNRVQVTLRRTSPSLIHMYMWALAPRREATPYELIEAIDVYLTKVNYPTETSRMEFTLIREVGEWYISVIHDEKFAQLQQQELGRQPFSAAASSPGVAAAAPPAKTTTTDDLGRQMADAQFNATLQSFNRSYQSPAPGNGSQAEQEEDKPSFLGKIARAFGLGGKEKKVANLTDANLKKTFNHIRDALALYTVGNQDLVPDSNQLYDWQTLRRLVNFYGKTQLPTTEAEAGFSFVNYIPDPGGDNYTLLLELHQPQDGVKRVEVTPYGVDRAS